MEIHLTIPRSGRFVLVQYSFWIPATKISRDRLVWFSSQSRHRMVMTTFWSTYIPSWWKNQPSLVRMGGGGAYPPPFPLSTITFKVVVRSSLEGRYIPPISTLPLYVLCSFNFSLLLFISFLLGHWSDHWSISERSFLFTPCHLYVEFPPFATYSQGWAKLVWNLMFSKRKALVF